MLFFSPEDHSLYRGGKQKCLYISANICHPRKIEINRIEKVGYATRQIEISIPTISSVPSALHQAYVTLSGCKLKSAGRK